VWAGLFCLSTAFPVVAGFLKANQLPGWVGYLDVIVALIWASTTLLLSAVAGNDLQSRAKLFSYQAYRALSHGLLIGLVVFFLWGDHINWNVLVPGLVWRFWLLIYALPAILTVWEMGKTSVRRDSLSNRS
jgi:hypothetical protein